MKSRITFARSQDTGLAAESIKISSHAIQITSLKAAREERVTVSLQELPEEVYYLRLHSSGHGLIILIISPGSSSLAEMSPASSEMEIPKALSLHSPFPVQSLLGFAYLLHSPPVTSSDVRSISLSSSLTPRAHLGTSDFLHPLLREAFGNNIQCASTPHFTLYIAQRICPENNAQCLKRADHLQEADYLDIDYDAISRSLTLTSFRGESPVSGQWSEEIRPYSNSAKMEVGILTSRKATDPEELALEGLLAVLGEDGEPNPTRFSFPSRHHAVERTTSGSTFTTSFPPPTGLHRTLRLTFPSLSNSPPAPACVLHTHVTLPSPIFIDKYQLSSPNFLASKNLGGIRALAGETDLEAPDWVIGQWGSALLLELAPPTPRHAGASLKSNSPWHADIPLHMRYLPPKAGGTSTVDVPWPVVFWACRAEAGTKMNVNPFDRVNLGYESLFGPRTMFYHLQPRPAAEGSGLVEQVEVPVMDTERATWVESGTVGVVVLGALWVVWKLLRVLPRDWRSEQAPIRKEKAQ
ncbi:MAG: hypothetical protein Q9208_002069 [Pyrenodesmia sp. 3 TL-2023]